MRRSPWQAIHEDLILWFWNKHRWLVMANAVVILIAFFDVVLLGFDSAAAGLGSCLAFISFWTMYWLIRSIIHTGRLPVEPLCPNCEYRLRNLTELHCPECGERIAGFCPQCHYDLQGEMDAGCPECGWRRGTTM